MRPLLLRHYTVHLGVRVSGREETLVIASERRRLVLQGRSFGTFVDRVVPLLDGRRTLQAVQEEVADVFDPRQVESCISLLAEQRVVIDADGSSELEERFEPQLGYLREVGLEPEKTLERLAAATVTIVGLGAVGAAAAASLAAAGIGRLRCVDGAAVSPADPALGQLFELDDVGRPRVEVVQKRIAASAPETSIELASVQDLGAAIDGADFALGCVDPGLVATTFQLNRACLEGGLAWTSGTATAYEGTVGPTVVPFETACYLCYEMRLVAAAEDPGDALAELKHRDRAGLDASGRRENLPFGSGIVGNLLALEAFKALLGARPSTAGRLLVVDLSTFAVRSHVILRKPWCPDCGAKGS